MILDVHRSAVRSAAASHYEQAIIDDWAPLPISTKHINELTKQIDGEEAQIIVAEDDDGKIIGFGAIAPAISELRAVYVAPEAERKGIGKSILEHLENMARTQGLSELRMDASINAERFYRLQDNTLIEYGEHIMESGRKMPCVKMQKKLLP